MGHGGAWGGVRWDAKVDGGRRRMVGCGGVGCGAIRGGSEFSNAWYFESVVNSSYINSSKDAIIVFFPLALRGFLLMVYLLELAHAV